MPFLLVLFRSDRKSTRLNSSHTIISYAAFCLNKNAQLKAWSDFMFAMGGFGFPQGFVYTINKLGASASVLARWSRLYFFEFLPIPMVRRSFPTKSSPI